MAAPKRTPVQRERDLADLAALYLQGKTQVEIAERLEVSQQQVSYDLKILQKRWQKSALRDLDAAKAEQLAKIDEMEREAWRSWELSKETYEQTVTEKVTTGEAARLKAYMKKEDRIGDPRYLQVVQWCINKRCEILGLNAPTRGVTLNLTRDELASMPDDELDRLIDSLTR